METGSEKPDNNNFSEKDIPEKESEQSAGKDDENKQSQSDEKKDEVKQEPLRLRLRIQRLKEEDFFVSIGGRDLIIKLKTEIFRFLEPEKSPESSAANLRLIYKGKVLADAKFVESYKIQNEDTIQLVPFNRPSRSAENPEDTENVADTKAEEEWSGNAEATTPTRPITLITFSTSIIEGPLVTRRSQGGTPERSIRQLRRLITPPANATSPRPWSPSRTMNNASIRSFRNILQSTLSQVSAVERLGILGNAAGDSPPEAKEPERELVLQLDTMLRTASMLRDDLQAAAVIQATESGLFSLMTRHEDERAPRGGRADSNQREPEQKDPNTGQETKSNTEEKKSEPVSIAFQPEAMGASSVAESARPLNLVTTLNESVTIVEQISSFELRYRRLALGSHFVFSFLQAINSFQNFGCNVEAKSSNETTDTPYQDTVSDVPYGEQRTELNIDNYSSSVPPAEPMQEEEQNEIRYVNGFFDILSRIIVGRQ